MSQSEENSQPDVKIFSLSTCSHCKSVKRLLDECTIQYEFTDVDLLKGKERTAILEDVKKFNPNCEISSFIFQRYAHGRNFHAVLAREEK